MNLTFHYHRNSNLVIEQPEYQKEYLEIENSLKEITDFDLIEEFNRRKGERDWVFRGSASSTASHRQGIGR